MARPAVTIVCVEYSPVHRRRSVAMMPGNPAATASRRIRRS
jgi:hypothetical protein